MSITKTKLIYYLDYLVFAFIALHFITAQISFDMSGTALGVSIIIFVIRLFYSRKILFTEKKLFIFLGILIAAQILSSVFSLDPLRSFSAIRKVLLYSGLFIAIIFIKDIFQLSLLLRVFFIFSALVSIYEITRYFIDLPNQPLPLTEFRINYFGGPGAIGEIKMIILLCIIPFFFLKKDYIFNKIILAIITIPIFISFFLTNTRSAYIGFFGGVLVCGMFKSKKFLVYTLVCITAFLILAPHSITNRILSITDLNHPSNNVRLVTWETGIKIFKDYPITGIGDIYLKNVYERYTKAESEAAALHMHNNILEMLVNFGLIGLISWLALMGYLIMETFKNYKKTLNNELLNILTIISLCCFTAFQLSGITEYNFGMQEFLPVLMFSMSLTFLSVKFMKNKIA